MLMFLAVLWVCMSVSVFGNEQQSTEATRDRLKKKDVRDYTDADLELLYEQWEEEDEPLEEDELPEWKKPQPKIDMSKLDPNDPESVLKMTKKGRTLMMFASVSGNPTEKETEQISQLWQSSLFNANIEIQRYVVGSDRVLFMLKDGSTAWDIKDYLVKQDRCQVVTIEGKDYYGKGSGQAEDLPMEDPKPETVKSKKKTPKQKKTAPAASEDSDSNRTSRKHAKIIPKDSTVHKKDATGKNKIKKPKVPVGKKVEL